MRKVLVLLLCIISLASLGQPIVNRASSANTVSDARLQAAINFYLPRYADTSFAASSAGIDSTGALIYTYVPNAIWVRKANPKKWVRITDANTNPYSAGYGLNLISNVFSVDSTVIATRGRLYKVVDSLIVARAQGLPSVLDVDNDADGRSIYNLSSLFTLDTLKTSGPFQLGSGAYTTSFPRTLTANRTMVVPDESDTLAGRIWTRNYVSSITPTTPGLAAVLGVSNTTSGATITGLPTPSGSSDAAPKGYVDAQVAAAGTLQAVTDAGNATTNAVFAGAFVVPGTPNSVASLADDGGEGSIAIYDNTTDVGASFHVKEWLVNYNTESTSKQFSFGSAPAASVSFNLPSDEAGNRNVATREWVTAQGYSTGGGSYTAGNGLLLTSTTFSADTVLLATRGRLYKTIDSMKTVNAAIYQTSASAATTYFPLVGGSVTGTGGAGFIGLIPQSSAPSTPASGVRLYASSTGAMTWKGTNGFQRTFSGSGITADRTYTLPDATGTLALTSDLSSYLTTATAAATYQTLAARVTKGVLVSWANSATVAANGTAYYGPGISGQTMGSTESARQTVSSVSGVIRSLYVKTLLTQSALDQMTVSVRVNGVTSGVTITIPAGAVAGTFSDTTHSIAVSAGDLISFILINSAAATSAGIASISIEITNN